MSEFPAGIKLAGMVSQVRGYLYIVLRRVFLPGILVGFGILGRDGKPQNLFLVIQPLNLTPPVAAQDGIVNTLGWC